MTVKMVPVAPGGSGPVTLIWDSSQHWTPNLGHASKEILWPSFLPRCYLWTEPGIMIEGEIKASKDSINFIKDIPLPRNLRDIFRILKWLGLYLTDPSPSSGQGPHNYMILSHQVTWNVTQRTLITFMMTSSVWKQPIESQKLEG